MTGGSLKAAVDSVGEGAAGPAADDVDRLARFPVEAIGGLRAAGVLGALVTPEHGGPGVSLAELSASVASLSQHCASSGLIMAMHQIQVACILRHGSPEAVQQTVPRLLSGELLLANANSEVGLGGDLRRSICALEPSDGGYRLEKQAATVSYGEYAEGVLATARRHPDSPPGEQAMAICLSPRLSLEPLGEWDALGMRGTCSRPGLLRAEVAPEMVIDDYPDLFQRTSQGYSAILLSSVWLGIAEAAGKHAHTTVREQVRKQESRPGGGPPSVGALRLAELSVLLHQLREVLAAGVAHFERAKDTEEVATIGFANRIGALKVASSSLLVDIVQRAVQICGLPAYKNDSPASLGRISRDAAAAPLMINNDRTLAAMAQVLPARKEL